MSKVEDFLSKTQEQHIIQAIKKAELHTSGEIRVHLEPHTKKDTIQRATEVFFQLKMNETNHKNGVLFYLAIENKQFAIIGDEYINTKVPDTFWGDITNSVIQEFKLGHFTEGLVQGILEVGKKLHYYFPYDKEDDINELSDEISIG